MPGISEKTNYTGDNTKGVALDSSDSATKPTEQKELSSEAREYKKFKDSHEPINMATIKEKLRDKAKYPYIKMNIAQKDLF